MKETENPTGEGLLTIGQLASKVPASVHTIRYYEKRGLFLPSKYSQSGYRLYDSDKVSELHVILFLRSLGFSLSEIRTLKKKKSSAGCSHARKIFARRKREVSALLADIQRTHATLSRLCAECGSCGFSIEKCPAIWKSLGCQES